MTFESALLASGSMFADLYTIRDRDRLALERATLDQERAELDRERLDLACQRHDLARERIDLVAVRAELAVIATVLTSFRPRPTLFGRLRALRRLISRTFAYADFVALPPAIAGVTIAAVATRGFGLATIGGALAGALLWTLIEYWTHRLLHAPAFPRLRRLHMAHHQAPTADSGLVPWSTLTILALTGVALAMPPAAPAILGLLGGYLWFGVLHHAEHHDWPMPGPLAGRAAAHHLHHHAGPRRMYGVTTGQWDRLFGTA